VVAAALWVVGGSGIGPGEPTGATIVLAEAVEVVPREEPEPDLLEIPEAEEPSALLEPSVPEVGIEASEPLPPPPTPPSAVPAPELAVPIEAATLRTEAARAAAPPAPAALPAPAVRAPAPAPAPPPRRAPAPSRRLGDGEEGLVVLWEPPRTYPREAIPLRLSGTTLVGFAIETTGEVTGVHVVRSSGHPILDEDALRKARAYRYGRLGERQERVRPFVYAPPY
jgi:protein TonB